MGEGVDGFGVPAGVPGAAIGPDLFAAFQFLGGAVQADQEHVMAVQELPEFGPHGGRFNDVVHHEVVPGVQQGGQAAVEALEDVRAEVRPVADFAFERAGQDVRAEHEEVQAEVQERRRHGVPHGAAQGGFAGAAGTVDEDQGGGHQGQYGRLPRWGHLPCGSTSLMSRCKLRSARQYAVFSRLLYGVHVISGSRMHPDWRPYAALQPG